MQAVAFDEIVELILQKDPRYSREAYQFLREALDHTQKAAAQQKKGEPKHVNGQQLLEGIRSYALDQFGPMALMVLNEWGIRRGEDFGEIVFNMVESGLLAKTEEDSREDFKECYNFEEAFRAPFLPRCRRTGPPRKKAASK